MYHIYVRRCTLPGAGLDEPGSVGPLPPRRQPGPIQRLLQDVPPSTFVSARSALGLTGVQDGGVGCGDAFSSTDAQQIMSFPVAEHAVPVWMNQDCWVRFLLADNLVPNLPPPFEMIWWTGLALWEFD